MGSCPLPFGWLPTATWTRRPGIFWRTTLVLRGGFLNKERVKTIGEGVGKNGIHPSHKSQEMTRHAKNAAAIRGACIAATSYPFRSNLSEVAFIGLFRQKRLETASLGALRSVSLYVLWRWSGTFLSTPRLRHLSSHKTLIGTGIGSALTVTCWLGLSQLQRTIMHQRPVPGDPASAPAITMMRPRLRKPV